MAWLKAKKNRESSINFILVPCLLKTMNYPNKVSAKVYQDEIFSFTSVAHLKKNANLYVFFESWALCSFTI